MKRKSISLMLLVAVVVGFSACKDDEEAPGKFTLGSKTYELGKAVTLFLEAYGSPGNMYYVWRIALASPGVNFDEDDKVFTGAGEVVLLTIYPKNDDSFLPEGTYDGEDQETWCDYVVTGYDFANIEGDTYYDFEEVTVTISKSGDTYTIAFTIVTVDGETITGSYTGAVQNVGD